MVEQQALCYILRSNSPLWTLRVCYGIKLGGPSSLFSCRKCPKSFLQINADNSTHKFTKHGYSYMNQWRLMLRVMKTHHTHTAHTHAHTHVYPCTHPTCTHALEKKRETFPDHRPPPLYLETLILYWWVYFPPQNPIINWSNNKFWKTTWCL